MKFADADGHSNLFRQTLNTDSIPGPENSSMDLEMELWWQDLLDVFEPENSETITPLNRTADSQLLKAAQHGVSDVLPGLSRDCAGVENQSYPIPEMYFQHDFSELQKQSEVEQVLTPSINLEDHSSPLDRCSSENCRLDFLPTSSNDKNLLNESVINEFFTGMDLEDGLADLDLNYFSAGGLDILGTDNQTTFVDDAYSYDLRAPNVTPTLTYLSPNHLTPSCGENAEHPSNQTSSSSGEPDSVEDPQRLVRVTGEASGPEAENRLKPKGSIVCEAKAVANQRKLGREEGKEEIDSDSGLSLDFSHSPASSSSSEDSINDPPSPSSCVSLMENPFSEDEGGLDAVLIKQEEQEEEELGAVGPEQVNHKQFSFGFSHQPHVKHDHTYDQRRSFQSRICRETKPAHRHKLQSFQRFCCVSNSWSRDERRARALKIPFPTELIVHLPVEQFNELLGSFQLSEEQLLLVRDIRRRGKNKIAAQNCRKRRQDVLLELEGDVAALKRRHSQLLRDKWATVRHLQDMKRRFWQFYQEIFSRLRNEAGMPLSATENILSFGPDHKFTVAPPATDVKHEIK